jgi:hypothetical protein
VRQEIEAAGFEQIEQPQLQRLSDNYFVIFRKKP